jgi:adenosylcobinamide amidohydrolase
MHVENNYNFDIYEYVKSFLTKNNLSSELTVNMTSVDIQKYQMENVSVGNYFVQATITAGFDNAISIGNKYGKPGTINMCVITDYPLTDSGAINLYQTCIEAKVQALNDMNIRDIMTGIVSPGTSTDTLSIFVINREKKYDYAGRLTEIGYETSLLVYNNLIKFGELR